MKNLNRLSDKSLRMIDTDRLDEKFFTKENVLDVTNEERDGDFQVHEVKVVDWKAVREAYPFQASLATVEERKIQGKIELERFMKNNSNIVAKGKDVDEKKQEVLTSKEYLYNPLANGNEDDRFIYDGGIIWNYRKFYLDGTYETYQGFDASQILSLLMEMGITLEHFTYGKAEKAVTAIPKVEYKKPIFTKLQARKMLKECKNDFEKYIKKSKSTLLLPTKESIELLEEYGIFFEMANGVLVNKGRTGEWKRFTSPAKYKFLTSANAHVDVSSFKIGIEEILNAN